VVGNGQVEWKDFQRYVRSANLPIGINQNGNLGRNNKMFSFKGKKVKCINCGFLGYKEGGISEDGSPYLMNDCDECNLNARNKLKVGNSYSFYHYHDFVNNNWTIIGCFHHVWLLIDPHTLMKDIEEGKKLLMNNRACPYYFPYNCGNKPITHNELKRDNSNQKTMLIVGIINGIAVLLAALLTSLLR
jgi:hypothetical protein